MMRMMAEPSSCARSEVRSEGVPEMTKWLPIGTFSASLVIAGLPHVQHNVLGGGDEAAEVDEALFELGQELYEAECAVCHQADGEGTRAFPALSENERLEDVELIVNNVHLGEGAMPAFPHLDAGDVAAVATYIRNAWGNEFGGVTTEEAASVLDEIAMVVERVSVWDGVYTEEQAERGRTVFHQCTLCHGTRGDGVDADPDQPAAPAAAGRSFLRNWDGRNVDSLYQFTRATMPQQNPGFLSDQEYIDAIAYMFELSGLPPGQDELKPDSERLAQVIIGLEPEDEDAQREEDGY